MSASQVVLPENERTVSRKKDLLVNPLGLVFIFNPPHPLPLFRRRRRHCTCACLRSSSTWACVGWSARERERVRYETSVQPSPPIHSLSLAVARRTRTSGVKCSLNKHNRATEQRGFWTSDRGNETFWDFVERANNCQLPVFILIARDKLKEIVERKTYSPT